MSRKSKGDLEMSDNLLIGAAPDRRMRQTSLSDNHATGAAVRRRKCQTIVLAMFMLLLSAILAYAQTAVVLNEKNLTPTPITANGASTVECVVGGFKSHTIEVAITGTATVTPECKLQPSGTYRPFKNSSGSVMSIIATDLIAITDYACRYTRINITNCTGCSVTAYCVWW